MLRVEHLGLCRGRFSLRDIALQIAEAEYFCLLGPTGSGKTMLIECIAGLNQPQTGCVLLGGRDITSLRPELREISYVPQDYALFPHLTVEGNIGAPCRVRRWPRSSVAQRVKELADLLHITHLLGRHPQNLSGGEKQRVALARALAVMPRLLLLDEPFSALDQQTRSRLRPEMKLLQERLRVTTVHVTHDFEEAALMAARIGVMEAGHLVQVGDTYEVFHRPATRSVAQFVGAENIFLGQAEPGCGDSCSCVVVGPGLRLLSSACRCGEVTVAIHPEDIVLENGHGGSSDPNQLRGTILEVAPLRSVMRVVADIGTPMVALVPMREWTRARLEVGRPVVLTIPPEAVHIFE